jgi:hypothetical protein
MDDMMLVLQDLRDIKNKPFVVEALFNSVSFSKVFESLRTEDA